MQRRLGGLVAALGACLAIGAPLASAQPPIAFGPCGESNELACGKLAVPLDPADASAGTLTLAIQRHRAPLEGPNSAVIALAGGPGQAALPFTGAFLELLGPVAATRDLIVFDQRGTGLSHRLSCHWPHHALHGATLGQAVQRCARQLGASRAFFTTPDSVADIEAIRRAGGYEKLVLYGTSYGTKVAEQYAEEHPNRVEALVLDSVVPPNGPEALDRPTFAAIPRILRQLCAFHECAHITRDPVADLARLVARMSRGAIVGRVFDGYGHAKPVRVSSDDLLELLLEGDFNPLLRAEFVPAVRAAEHGDDAALARLLARAEGIGREGGSDETPALYLTTTCEEELFPWSRAASPGTRLHEAVGQLDVLPASVFDPFTAANALDLGDMRECAYWPFATAAPPLAQAPMPEVPTLVLSGADDLRTPTSGAREVASQIPGAHLLVVPLGGHSVLGNEPTPCAVQALHSMFAGKRIASCPSLRPPPILRLPPLPPPSLSSVAPTPGYGGLPGRTLNAVLLTLRDFERQSIFALIERLGSGGLPRSPLVLRGGGLRGGWFSFSATDGLRFHDYAYVPGVTLSGSAALHGENLLLRIGGAAAARGTLRMARHGALAGTLGGRHVFLRRRAVGLDSSARTSAGASDASTRALLAQAREMLGPLPEDEAEEAPYALGSELGGEPPR